MATQIEKKICDYLHSDDSSPNPEVIRSVIDKSSAVMTNCHFRQHRSLWEILLEQFRFIGWRIWLLQASVFCMALALEASCMSVPTGGRLLPVVLSLMSVLVTLSMLPFLYRAKQYLMLEVESSAWLSGRRLMFIRATLFSACDILCSVSIFLTALHKSDTSVWVLFASAMLPCLAASISLLYLIQKEDLTEFGNKFVLLCVFIAVIIAVLNSKPHPGWFSIVQGCLTVLLFTVYVMEIIKGLQSSEGVIYA